MKFNIEKLLDTLFIEVRDEQRKFEHYEYSCAEYSSDDPSIETGSFQVINGIACYYANERTHFASSLGESLVFADWSQMLPSWEHFIRTQYYDEENFPCNVDAMEELHFDCYSIYDIITFHYGKCNEFNEAWLFASNKYRDAYGCSGWNESTYNELLDLELLYDDLLSQKRLMSATLLVVAARHAFSQALMLWMERGCLIFQGWSDNIYIHNPSHAFDILYTELLVHHCSMYLHGRKLFSLND